jgi:hypothetical protein
MFSGDVREFANGAAPEPNIRVPSCLVPKVEISSDMMNAAPALAILRPKMTFKKSLEHE